MLEWSAHPRVVSDRTASPRRPVILDGRPTMARIGARDSGSAEMGGIGGRRDRRVAAVGGGPQFDVVAGCSLMLHLRHGRHRMVFLGGSKLLLVRHSRRAVDAAVEADVTCVVVDDGLLV